MRYVKEVSTGEYEEKKSKFIAELYPIRTVNDVDDILSSVKKRYYDARHHCYAYVLGDDNEIQKQSDDGEPSQTAGMPIMNVIKSSDLRNVLLVVTRYFGGTLLGTGGLVRAYTESSKEAVKNAILLDIVVGYRVVAELSYDMIGKVKYITEKLSIREENVSYTDIVRCSWLVPKESLEVFKKELNELSHGSINLAIEETQWYSN